MNDLRIHEAARLEAAFATQWYMERSPSSSRRFTEVLVSAFAKAQTFPARYPAYLHGTRRINLRKFPYSIVYLEWQDETFIVAVAHAKQRPGYWKDRI